MSHVKRATQDRLPQHDPLLAKMAASKRGSPSVSVQVSGVPSVHPAQRRKNPMTTMRDNAIRVKRFRELKATLRSDRHRLLVGLDIAQAAHAVHLRHAHTRVVHPGAHGPEHHPGVRAALGADPASAARDGVPGDRLRSGADGDLPRGDRPLPRRAGGGRRPRSPAPSPTGTAGPRTGPGTSTTGRTRPTAPISWSRARSSSTASPTARSPSCGAS